MNAWLPQSSYPLETCTPIMREMKDVASTDVIIVSNDELLCKEEMKKIFQSKM